MSDLSPTGGAQRGSRPGNRGEPGEPGAGGGLDERLRALIERSDAAEAALQASRDDLAAVLEAVADGITVQDATGRVTWANEAAARLCGYDSAAAFLVASPAEIGARFEMLDEAGRPYPPADLPGQRVLRGEASGQALVRYRLRASGDERWSTVKARPVRDAEGRVRAAVNVFSDVTVLQRARQRLAIVGEASAIAASTLDYEETLERVAHLAVPRLADGCAVDILDAEGVLRRRAIAHADPARLEAARALYEHAPLNPDAPHGPAAVLRSRRAELQSEITDADLEASARSPEHLAFLRALRVRSQIVVPLISRGEVIGTITFVYLDSDRRYSAQDLPVAEEIARRCAAAIDNARLYQAAQAAGASARRRATRLDVLADAARAFAEAALDLPTLLDTVAERFSAVAGDACIIRLRDEDEGRLSAVAFQHPDGAAAAALAEATRRASDAPDLPLVGRVLAGAAPIVLAAEPGGDLRDQVSPAYRDYAVQRGAIGAYFTPLLVRGDALGVVSLIRERPATPFTVGERRFFDDLAGRAALAIDNALRYGAERGARAEAEAANRAKDEFLSILSHELRTPLTSMLGWVQLLRRGNLSTETAATALDTIERAARAQVQVVGDILDVSRIVTGKLRLEPAPLDPRAPIEAAARALEPTATAKGVTLTLALDTDAAPVRADADRLQQIIWNLLSNAIKFTPRGGRVAVRLQRSDEDACITVTDTGIGIAPIFLPYVFGRFRQADTSSTRAHGGLGLGLAIVRHLVELHGGSVTAESDGLGHGATFTVRLPLATAGDDDTRGYARAR